MGQLIFHDWWNIFFDNLFVNNCVIVLKRRHNIGVIAPNWPSLKNEIIFRKMMMKTRWLNDHRAYHEITKVGKHAHTKHSHQRCGVSLSISHGKVKIGPKWHLSVTVAEAGTRAYAFIHIYVYIIKIVYKGVGGINKWKTN